jgi:uncharacterized protein YceK
MQSQNAPTLSATRSRQAIAMIFLALTMLPLTGCAAISLTTDTGNASPAATESAQYQVRLQSNFGKSPTYLGDIDGPVTIQDALELSGAIKKYRDMEVDLYRKLDGSYQPLKMSAIYDAGKKTVRPETNYGLRPGDSILVKTKSQNPLGKVLGQFSQ